MVGVLIRMKLAVLRHRFKGGQRVQLGWSVLFGLVAIAATIWVSLLRFDTPGLSSDLLALSFGFWGLAWILGPLMFGGEDKTLLPEHFRSLPITPRQLATGLLGASFVDVPVVISLLAFTSLTIYASQLGIVPALVSVPALALQLLFLVILSRVTTNALREFTRSHLSAILGSLVTGALMAFLVSGWAIFAGVDDLVANGVSPTLSKAAHAAPSGWGIVAIESAYAGAWLRSAGALIGLALLIVVLRSWWVALLARRLTTRRTQSRVSQRPGVQIPDLFASPLGAVVYKELLTWGRDFTRTSFIYFAFFFSVFLCLYPVAIGASYTLPFIGLIFAMTAIGSVANLYGIDGSALWMTLVIPNATRHDVRGRQAAWFIIVAPVALAATLLMIAVTGFTWALPGTLTLVIAALGAGAGLIVLNSVYRLVPMIDPHERGKDMFDHPISWWQYMSLQVISIILIAPACSVVLLGARTDKNWLEWAAIVVAVAMGALYYWWFGRLAYQRLDARGPELLHLMLKGPSNTEPQEIEADPAKPDFNSIYRSMPRIKRLLFIAGLFIGPIALFPQGLVPLGLKLSGSDTRVWFLALYLPEIWQWPVIAFMVALGLSIFGLMARLILRQKCRITR